MSFVNKLPLPHQFLGVLPLYIGVELILGIAILNKVSGLYGILSIFTGHPLNFVQWLLYITSIVVVPCYVLCLKNISTPKILENAVAVVIYSIDTITSLVFILWFCGEWLFNEDVKFEKIPGGDYSKSASPAYEYGWIFLTSAGVNAARVYFNLVLFSFYKKLLRFNKMQGDEDVLKNGDELNLKNKNLFSRWNYQLQVKCYKLLGKYI